MIRHMNLFDMIINNGFAISNICIIANAYICYFHYDKAFFGAHNVKSSTNSRKYRLKEVVGNPGRIVGCDIETDR